MKSPHLYYIAALLLLGFLLFQKPAKEYIKVPAIVGSIKPAPITYLEPKGEPLRVIWKDRVIERKEPLNDSLLKAYKDLELKYKDTELELQRAQMFIDAITLRDFESQLEDRNLKVTLSGTVQGYLKEIEIKEYKIKEREIEVKRPRLFILGLQMGYGMTIYGQTPYVGVGGTLNIEEGIRRLLGKPILRF